MQSSVPALRAAEANVNQQISPRLENGLPAAWSPRDTLPLTARFRRPGCRIPRGCRGSERAGIDYGTTPTPPARSSPYPFESQAPGIYRWTPRAPKNARYLINKEKKERKEKKMYIYSRCIDLVIESQTRYSSR